MRITNNMMVNNTTSNINGNKINVNDLNLQMSSQKKIQRPSEDPVVAIRALRLRSTLSQINQYYGKNIPDAQAWLEATETALHNMNKILSDLKQECVKGTNDYLTADDRNTLLKGLSAFQKQLYSEGNADNAGRTVFTGYKTGSQLTFMEDEPNTHYEITQKFSYKDIEEYNYFTGSVQVPETVDGVKDVSKITDIQRDSMDRIRLAYDNISMDKITRITFRGSNGQVIAVQGEYFPSEEQWQISDNPVTKKRKGVKEVPPGDVYAILDTGELILGETLSKKLKDREATIEITYEKTGFGRGELRPEYYYNCKDITDAAKPITYEKYDASGKKIYEDINYTVAINQTLTVNLQADEVFDMNIYQDVGEMLTSVQNAINAHEKTDRLKAMKNEAKYAGCQQEVQQWIDAAQQEADYADRQLTELFSAGIGKFDKYMQKLNIAYTEIGAKGDQLEMTETRISNLQLTQEELMSDNENKELSDIIIEYTAAFNAYQASLLSASKIEKQTLLDYI